MSKPELIQSKKEALSFSQQQKAKMNKSNNLQAGEGEELNQKYIENQEVRNPNNLTVNTIIQKIYKMDAFAEQWSNNDKTMGIQFLKKCFNRINPFEQIKEGQQTQKWKSQEINADILKETYKKLSKKQQELQKQLNYVQQSGQTLKKKHQEQIYQKILNLVQNSNAGTEKNRKKKQNKHLQKKQKDHTQKQSGLEQGQEIKQGDMLVQNEDDQSSSFNMDRENSLSSSHEDVDRDGDNFSDNDRDESEEQKNKNIDDGYESNGQYDQKQQNDNEDGYNLSDERANDD